MDGSPKILRAYQYDNELEMKKQNSRPRSRTGFRTIGLCLMVLVALSLTSQAFSGLFDQLVIESIEWTEGGDQEESQEEENNKEFDGDKYFKDSFTINYPGFDLLSVINPVDHLAEIHYHKIIDPPPEA